MRTSFIFCMVLTALSCSEARPEVDPNQAKPAQGSISVPTKGDPYALRFQQGALVFCDANGGHSVDLKTGEPAAAEVPCKRDEANQGCGGGNLDAEVRSPASEPDDIVDVAGESYPMKGRVHDCTVEGKALGVATNANVVVIDTGDNSVREAKSEGADRVALSAEWIAWSDGPRVNAVRRSTLKKQKQG